MNFFKRKKDVVPEIRTVDERDVIFKVELLIEEYFFSDSGFLNRAKNLSEYTECYMPYDTTLRDIYISAYNSNLLGIEKGFSALLRKLKEADPDNGYKDYCKSPIFKLVKEYTERIKTDRLDIFEGADYEEYRTTLLSYVEDLVAEISALEGKEG